MTDDKIFIRIFNEMLDLDNDNAYYIELLFLLLSHRGYLSQSGCNFRRDILNKYFYNPHEE